MSDIKEIKDLNQLAELIAASVANLSKEQLTELLAILKDTYELEPTAPEVVQVAAEIATVEQTEFNGILVSDGGNKMPVIKAWKPLSGKSLMEAKADVTSAPITLREKVSKEEAEAIKQLLKKLVLK